MIFSFFKRKPADFSNLIKTGSREASLIAENNMLRDEIKVFKLKEKKRLEQNKQSQKRFKERKKKIETQKRKKARKLENED